MYSPEWKCGRRAEVFAQSGTPASGAGTGLVVVDGKRMDGRMLLHTLGSRHTMERSEGAHALIPTSLLLVNHQVLDSSITARKTG